MVQGAGTIVAPENPWDQEITTEEQVTIVSATGTLEDEMTESWATWHVDTSTLDEDEEAFTWGESPISLSGGLDETEKSTAVSISSGEEVSASTWSSVAVALTHDTVVWTGEIRGETSWEAQPQEAHTGSLGE